MINAGLFAAMCAHLREGERLAAARLFAASAKVAVPRTDADAVVYLRQVLRYFLEADKYEEAAELLWGSAVFSCQPRCTQMVWRNFRAEPFVLLQGAASMSKSYGGGAYLLLDWLRDPEYTTIKLVGPSEQHLEDNLFSHIIKMHQDSAIPLPGHVGKLFIGLDPRQRRSAISGIVIPIGKKSGRLQGSKRFPRKGNVHPVFGRMSRLKIFIDEFENVPPGVIKDIENVMANYNGTEDAGTLFIGAAYNPTNIGGPAGVRAEPLNGWGSFNMETDEEWKSKRGWKVVRLDAAKCENVMQRKTIFHGLQTYEGYQAIIRGSGGTESAGYFTFCRACFPMSGNAVSVIPQLMLDRSVATVTWRETPRIVVGIDIALEGGDTAKLAWGKAGVATGVTRQPTIQFPQGETVVFQGPQGRPGEKYLVQLCALMPLPKGDTWVMAQEVVRVCRLLNVDPDWVTMDRTGNGAGVHDIVKTLWSSAVRGVNYYQAASDKKIVAEDKTTAHESVNRMVSELWVALRKWMDYGRFFILPEVSLDKLGPQLVGRQISLGKVDAVESKKDFTDRNNPSPDEADATTLMLHSARMASGEIPAVTQDEVATFVEVNRGQRFAAYREGGAIIGITDRFSGLNDEGGADSEDF
jgi:hypothetical protein